MAKTFELKAQIREHSGTKSSIKYRNSGRIPAVVYGHKQEPVIVTVDFHDFTEALHHGHRLFNLQTADGKQMVIVKGLQYDHLGKNVIHVDLIRVNVAEKIKVTVPLEAKGIAKGTNEGGVIEEHLNQIDIECKATEIPEVIYVNVKEVNVGDNLRVSDIELPEGVKLLSPPDLVVVTCSLVAAAKSTEELEEEVPVEPEVIGKVTEEQDQSESAKE